jgi:hypothetical protein
MRENTRGYRRKTVNLHVELVSDVLRPDPSKLFRVHVDCDFAGNWVKEDAMNDPSTVKSRTGYVIS